MTALTALSLWIGLAVTAWSNPAQVIIIRHAEKPRMGNKLSERGRRRANKLVDFFQSDSEVMRYGEPSAIYARAPDDPSGSVRSIQTVKPLAQSLGLPINTSFKKEQIPELVRAIRSNPTSDGKMVLICWEHVVIPKIIEEFGWTSAPSTWPDDVYDRVWILDFDESGKPVSFKEIPEHVLPGDSAD